MGSVRRGIDALLGIVDISNPAAVQATRLDCLTQFTLPDVDSLTTLELLYELIKSEGMELAGDPKRGFAAFDDVHGSFYVYTKEKNFVNIVPHDTVGVLTALQCAQDEGASFTVCEDKVICVLRDVTAMGATYGDAALRALVKYQWKNNPLQPGNSDNSRTAEKSQRRCDE